MQVCEKCGSQKILENDVPKCIFCFGKQQVEPKRPPVMIEDPGEEKLAKFMPQATTGTKSAVSRHQVAPKAMGTLQDALTIMQRLPMPKDVKEFRKIQKIIKLMEELVGE